MLRRKYYSRGQESRVEDVLSQGSVYLGLCSGDVPSGEISVSESK